MHIAIVDYGMGNLRSVSQALAHVAPDCEIRIANDPADILRSDRVVLPGQGAMPDCMKQLRSSGLMEAVLQSVREKPLLGICVGEQMLFEESEERKPGITTNTACLGLMPGSVKRFDLVGTQEDGSEFKIPHMGWNQVRQDRDHPMWHGIPDMSSFYFVHSYFVQVSNPEDTVGSTNYGGWFTSAVARDTIFATQFHPEKSAQYGLKLYQNFVNWRPWLFSFDWSMLLIPAIDIKDGHCVRLEQGDMQRSTVFSEDPAAMAKHWLSKGARRLHLVDLNGAFAGKPKNEAAIKAILKAVGDDIPVQLGGGVRDMETIERLLDDGISTIIIGTAAVKNPGFLQDACTAFSGHIMVGLDAKDGKVATDGWSKLTGHEVIDLAKKFEDYGVEAIIYTDIGRDGMLKGINLEATVKLAQSVRIPVIASGGLSNKKDIEALCSVEDEGITGVIAGRSIYNGDLDLAEAQKYADQLTKKNK